MSIPCPICGLDGGFHEDAPHSVPQPPEYVHTKKVRLKQERPSDEEIARLRALKKEKA